MTNTNPTEIEITSIYSVLYRNDGQFANACRVQPGQHAVREFRTPDGASAIALFKESLFAENATVIAVFAGASYDVSVMV